MSPPDGVEGLVRQVAGVGLEHAVQVLVVAPRHNHVFQAAVLAVHAQTRAQLRVLAVRIVWKKTQHDM